MGTDRSCIFTIVSTKFTQKKSSSPSRTRLIRNLNLLFGKYLLDLCCGVPVLVRTVRIQQVEEDSSLTYIVLGWLVIAMNPFVQVLVNKLPNQSHKKAIVVDEHLRVKGSPLGTVYAVGDAATVGRDVAIGPWVRLTGFWYVD